MGASAVSAGSARSPRSPPPNDRPPINARRTPEIVCELIGGTTLARHATLAAIAAGKHVVTANKAVLAEHGAEVFSAAERAGVDVYYEAAVCGGVPVIRVLREGALPASFIEGTMLMSTRRKLFSRNKRPPAG